MPKLTEFMVKGPVLEEAPVHLTSDVERDLDARLASIEGHVRSVRRMLAEQRDCDGILIQMAAVKAAMNQIIIMLLERHFEACATECATTEEGDKALAELKRALGIVLKSS
jgi:DNA-binding FrmR family transcriptional regulator